MSIFGSTNAYATTHQAHDFEAVAHQAAAAHSVSAHAAAIHDTGPHQSAHVDAHKDADAKAHAQSDKDYIAYLAEFYETYIDHKNDEKVTAVTNMLDQAKDNLTHAQTYLKQNPVPHSESYLAFLDNGMRAMDLFKKLSQNGYQTIDFLSQSYYEIELVKTSLGHQKGHTEDYLALYLVAALEEVNIARYLQELQVKETTMTHHDGDFDPSMMH